MSPCCLPSPATFSKNLSTYQQPQHLPHYDSKLGENKSQSRPNTIFISDNADRGTWLYLWVNELPNNKTQIRQTYPLGQGHTGKGSS